jgi:hypothetical protein
MFRYHGKRYSIRRKYGIGIDIEEIANDSIKKSKASLEKNSEDLSKM